jgi:DNA-binding transcriptional ArsR family regulator
MEPDQLSAVFSALSDPTRRAILARLAEGDAIVLELTAPFKVSQPAISRHLKVLERAGLISRKRRATARLSHLQAEPLRGATSWLVGYRAYWDESYERLDELLTSLQGRRSTDPEAGDRGATDPEPTGPRTTEPNAKRPSARRTTRHRKGNHDGEDRSQD